MAKRRRMVDTSLPESEEEVGPSRSKQRVARQTTQARLEALGERLTRLPARAYARLELGDEVEREVGLLRGLQSGSALSRQRRRVAGLLRGLDLDELERRVEEAAGASAQSGATSYRLERLRKELLSEDGDAALGRLFDAHPTLDRPRLQQALRAARREAEAGAPGKRFKELFQVLKDLGVGRPEGTPEPEPEGEPG